MIEMRGKPGAEAPQQNPNLPTWVRWSIATGVGYVIGISISALVVAGPARPLGFILWGVFNVLLYGAIVGLFIGLCQFAVMARGLVPFQSWILASMRGGAIGFAFGAVVAEQLSNMISPTTNYLIAGSIALDSAGAIIGLAFGVCQWRVFRLHLPRQRGWIAASALGGVLGTVLAGLLLIENPQLEDFVNPVVGAALGLVAGILQGLVLRSIRRKVELLEEQARQ